jgi:hypothetical protein
VVALILLLSRYLLEFPILDEGKSLFLHTGEKNIHMSDVLREIEQDQHITLLVGPEG